MNRAERRRQERAHAKGERVIIAGAGIIASPLPGRFRSEDAAGRMPAKQKGKHRWVVVTSYTLPEGTDPGEWAGDAANPALLDHESLLLIGVTCWDCEQPHGMAAMRCPAGNEWT